MEVCQKTPTTSVITVAFYYYVVHVFRDNGQQVPFIANTNNKQILLDYDWLLSCQTKQHWLMVHGHMIHKMAASCKHA